MPPMQGHLMVPKAMRILKFAIARAKTLIRPTPSAAKQTYTTLNPIRAYTQKTIPVHPDALLKQSKSSRLQPQGSRPYSSAQHPRSQARGPKYDRSSFPSSRTSRTIARNGTAPFASTLRPNLTGGTLPRSAGGYGLGGAGRARQFSHTSGCQAQVVQNVSAGIRAFLINGSKARFDGIDPATGEKNWRSVTETQNEMYKKWTAAPYSNSRGTSLDFQLCPTVTALLPTSSSSSSSDGFRSSSPADHEPTTLNSTGVLRTLSSDFARAFRDLALVTHDLSKLATFGDLPLSLVHTPSGPLLRVRFPGCDADTVSALCDEVDIRRGVIVEDPSWTQSRDADMALLFPFAPTGHPYSESDSESGLGGLADYGREYFVKPGRKVGTILYSQSLTPTTLSSPSSQSEEDYTSLTSQIDASEGFPSLLPSSSASVSLSSVAQQQQQQQQFERASAGHSSHSDGDSHDFEETKTELETAQYEGVEGIYRFLQEIEDARR